MKQTPPTDEEVAYDAFKTATRELAAAERGLAAAREKYEQCRAELHKHALEG